jgi:hypothetical protein
VRLWMQRLTKDKVSEPSVAPLQELTQSDPVRPKIAWPAAALFLVVSLTTAAVIAQLRSTVAPETLEVRSPVPSVTESPDLVAAPAVEGSADNLVATQASVTETKDAAFPAPQAKAAARATPLAISVEPSHLVD